jgi:radical SAM protein with 4Fe4S-binding SPASM domain
MSDKETDDYYKNHEYHDRKPIYIAEDKLRPDQMKRLTESKTFCMIPWIHVHAFPNGQAFPCCLADSDHPIGDLHKNTIKEVWNDTPYKTMRKNMLEEKTCKECTKCYEQEDMGFVSMRNSSNKSFGHNIGIVDDTKPDGTFDDFKLRYYDIRFSNLCNMSCRTCGGWFSSSWHDEETDLYGKREYPKFMFAGKDKEDMWNQLQEHIPYLEQVYFAGGEPLIMEEHYRLLDELERQELFDVRLQYNTNFSKLKLKTKHVFDYWQRFKNVSVGASLDAMGARAEYMRKGTVWAETVSNREKMLQECPNTDFYVSSTVSIYNALHVMDFHRDWVERGLIKAQDWNINILQGPSRDRIDVLPKIYKEQVKEKILEHIEWLRPQDHLNRAVVGYESILTFMENQDQQNLLQEFLEVNDKHDDYRKEQFETVFPEYKELRTYVST